VGSVFRFEWKSSWCSSLYPIYPVEMLFDTKPLVSPMNAQCLTCDRCVDVCADSTPRMDPLVAENQSRLRAVVRIVMYGFFPGFVWGWFQVEDSAGTAGWSHLAEAFGLLWLSGFVTLATYLMLRAGLEQNGQRILKRSFAESAVSCYYWLRLPGLFGFGQDPGDGMLVDLTGALPAHWVLFSRIFTTSFFFWWMLRRPALARPWSQRPEFA
jgi:hypothetical protein